MRLLHAGDDAGRSALTRRQPSPTDDDVRWAISGNLCRCTGYMNIVKAIQAAGAATTAELRPHDHIEQPTTPPEIGGIGHSPKRQEDARLIEGQGNFVDDVVLPGMLHMAILRSPSAHARINGIDSSAAEALDGVVAVVTGALMDEHGSPGCRRCRATPRRSGDRQGPVPGPGSGRGRRHRSLHRSGRARADRGRLRAAAGLITPQQALEDGAVLIRDEKEGQTDNLVYEWEAGDASLTDDAFAKADRVVTLETHYPRSHPSPLETCGDRGRRQLRDGPGHRLADLAGPPCPPHALRDGRGLPEQNIRIISPDIGGGFGNKVPIYPGYVVATAASLADRQAGQVDRDPQREPDLHRLRPRLLHEGRAGGHRRRQDPGPARRHVVGPGCVLRRRPADPVQGGLFHVVTGSYDYPAAHVTCRGAFTNKAAGGVAYRCSFRITEASFLIERLVQNAAYELGIDPAEFRLKNFIQPDQFPYEIPYRVRLRLGRLSRPRCAWRWTRWATRPCAKSRQRLARRAASSGSESRTSPRPSGPARPSSTTSPG